MKAAQMTLDDLLALLPDNNTGEISAADMRTIVTELFKLAGHVDQVFAFDWIAADPSPNAGKATTDAGWTTAATKLVISETTSDGATLLFSMVDGGTASKVWIDGAAGGRLAAVVTGPSVDMGAYREIPIQVESATNPAPGNNERLNVSFVALAQ